MPRGSFREGWGNDYSFEPIDVYGEKESQRAADLVTQASQQKYGTGNPTGIFGSLARATQRAVDNAGSQPQQQPDDGSGWGQSPGWGGVFAKNGNIDTSKLPAVNNPDGSVSTVRSISIDVDGKEVLIPTVIDGRVVSNDEAIQSYRQTGRNLGTFANPAAADAYAQQLHEREAKRISQPQQGDDGGWMGGLSDFLSGAKKVGSVAAHLGEQIGDLNPAQQIAKPIADIATGNNPIPGIVTRAQRSMSGEKFLGDAGIDTSGLPDKWYMPVRQAVDVAAAPATYATLGLGGSAVGGARSITGSILKNVAVNTAVNTGIGEASKRAEDLPGWRSLTPEQQQAIIMGGTIVGGHFAPKALGAIRNSAVKLDAHINEPVPRGDIAPERFIGAVDPKTGSALPIQPIMGAGTFEVKPGDPLYHGSPNPIEGDLRAGKGDFGGEYGTGAYVSPETRIPDQFARGRGGQPGADYPVGASVAELTPRSTSRLLDLQEPLTQSEQARIEAAANGKLPAGRNGPPTGHATLRHLMDIAPYTEDPQTWASKVLKDAGFDGVRVGDAEQVHFDPSRLEPLVNQRTRAAVLRGDPAAHGVLPVGGGSLDLGAFSKESHADPYFEAAQRHGIDLAMDENGHYYPSDPAHAEETISRLVGQGLETTQGTKQGPGYQGFGGSKFGSAERAAEDVARRGRAPSRGAGAMPAYTEGANQDLQDAMRIQELLSDKPVSPLAEAKRTPFSEAGSVTPTEPDALLQSVKASRPSTKIDPKNIEAAQQGIQEADAFVNPLIGPNHSPDSIATVIDAHIAEREHATNIGKRGGRKGLNITEVAYRHRLTDLHDELLANGHDAVHTVGDGSPVPTDRALPGAVQAEQGHGSAPGAASDNVQAPDLFGGVHDTGLTEAQHNSPAPAEPAPVTPTGPKPIQQGFGGAVQELPLGETPPHEAAIANGVRRTQIADQLPIDKGQGIAGEATRGANAVSNEAPPALMPPGEPPVKEPPGVGHGAPQTSFEKPGPSTDLLRTKPRENVVSSGTDYADTNKGKIRTMGSKAIGGISDPTVTAIKKEYEATGHRVVEIPRVMRTRLEADARAAGLNFTQDDSGVWTIDGHPGTDVGQVIEANTPEAQAVRDSLSDPQRAVLDKMKAFTGEVNQTMEARGLTVPHRDTETGDYLARMVLGRESDNGFTPKGGTTGSSSRVIGSNKLGPRTQETMTGAAEQGIRYASPWDAFEASNRAKLRMAQDAYVGDLVKPLGVKDAGVGSGMRALKGDHPAFATTQAVGNAFDGEHVVTKDNPLKFKDDIARQLDEVFSPNPISATRAGQAVQAINSATIPIRAAFDMSAVGGRLGFLVSSPTNFVKGLKAVPQVVKSAMGHPEAIDALRKAENDRTLTLLNKAGVEATDGAVYHVQRNLHLVGEEGGEELNFGKTSAIRAGAEKVGLGKAADALDKGMAWSNETFNRYLDYARHVMANDALERGISKGLKGGELDKFVEESNQGVNRVTGYTNTKPSSLESMLLFAPRFNRSMVEELGALTKMGSQEQMMAVKHLSTMLGVSTVMVTAWNQAHGYDTTFDPRDPNFLAARNVAGQDVKPLGSLSTLFRGASELALGKPGEDNLPNPSDAAKYFFRSKASPALGSLWSAIVGSNYNGESFDFKTPGDAAMALVTIGKEALPFSAQAGVNEGPLGALTSASGFNSSPMTPGEQRDFKRDEIAQKSFGAKYPDLTGPQKAKVNQDSGVMGLDKQAQNNALDQADTSRSKPAEAQRDFQAAMTGNDKFLAAHQTPDGKPFSGVDYRKSYIDLAKTRRDFLAGAGVKGGSDPEVDGFFALYDKAKMENGATNFDQLDQLQADYASRHPGVLAKIASETGTKDTPTMQAMRTAMGQAKEYYQIPKYTGMDAASAQKADNVINQAAPLTANGVVGSRQAAYQYLVDHGRVSADDVAIANQATRAGTNPERKAFKVSHPEFAQFYGGVSSEDVASIGTVASSSGATSIPGIRGIGSSRSSSTGGGGSLSRVQARRAGGLRR